MNVKVQGLLNAARWIEETHGNATLRSVLAGCSPKVRERCSFGLAMSWHPADELIELLTVAEQRIGRHDGKVAEAIGAAGARANLRGILIRFARYVLGPEYLAQRIAGMWRQFNDEGEMRVVRLDDHQVVLEMAGIARPNWLFCCTLAGWCVEVASAMGARNAHVRHSHCRSRGDTRCLYEIRWSKRVPTEPPRA